MLKSFLNVRYLKISDEIWVSNVLQLLLTTRQSTSALAAARTHQRYRLRQAVAASDARHGRWTNGARLDAARGAAVPRAAVAAASGGVSAQGGGKRHGEAA